MSSLDRAYCPEAGDFIWIAFDPQAGRERAGRRPAIVLSPRRYNSLTQLCVLCPITSQIKGYPFEVIIPSGLPITGVVLSDQVKSLSWDRRRSAFICESPTSVVQNVKARIKALLMMT
jgi:mRNA interferase MazF